MPKNREEKVLIRLHFLEKSSPSGSMRSGVCVCARAYTQIPVCPCGSGLCDRARAVHALASSFSMHVDTDPRKRVLVAMDANMWDNHSWA